MQRGVCVMRQASELACLSVCVCVCEAATELCRLQLVAQMTTHIRFIRFIRFAVALFRRWQPEVFVSIFPLDFWLRQRRQQRRRLKLELKLCGRARDSMQERGRKRWL